VKTHRRKSDFLRCVWYHDYFVIVFLTFSDLVCVRNWIVELILHGLGSQGIQALDNEIRCLRSDWIEEIVQHNEIRCLRSDWTEEIVQGRGIENMPKQCTVLPRGGDNDQLNRARPAVSVSGLRLICCWVSLRLLLFAGPAGKRQSRDCACCWARAWRDARDSQSRDVCAMLVSCQLLSPLRWHSMRQIERYQACLRRACLRRRRACASTALPIGRRARRLCDRCMCLFRIRSSSRVGNARGVRTAGGPGPALGLPEPRWCLSG
jgi:hypothetical protein